MLDVRDLCENITQYKEILKTRNVSENVLDEIVDLNKNRIAKKQKSDQLRTSRNEISKKIGSFIAKGEKDQAEKSKEEVLHLKEELDQIAQDLTTIEQTLKDKLSRIPNLPHKTTPIGKDETENVEITRVGIPQDFDFSILPHEKLGVDLDMIDFEKGIKITGAGFVLLHEDGAMLNRALINFMLDTHVKNGYSEQRIPFVVQQDSLFGTGQLPKFEEDLYHIEGLPFYLNPTAEVALTNMYRDEILEEDDLPKWFTAYSPSYRKEAGSHGKDTKGLIRVHEFDKVELVMLSHPKKSIHALNKMTMEARSILDLLKLPYRVIALCTGDLGFSSAKTFDIEVWLPSWNAYKEISSVSDTWDFQARRANIRYRDNETKKLHFVHTLNGSGLAVGRTLVAILENYQTKDHELIVPEVLRPYINKEIIKLHK